MAASKKKAETATASKKTSKKAMVKRRAATIEKRQAKLKEKLLVQLEKMPVVEFATKRAGASSSTYYRWINEDPMFARAAQQALDTGVQYINDMAESKLISGIAKEDRTMIIFWLKNRHHAYTDKQLHTHVIPESPLTEERKREIAEALQNWNKPHDDDNAYTVYD